MTRLSLLELMLSIFNDPSTLFKDSEDSAKHQPAPVSEQLRKPAGNRAPLPIRQAKAAPARNFARTSSDRRTASFSLCSPSLQRGHEQQTGAPASNQLRRKQGNLRRIVCRRRPTRSGRKIAKDHRSPPSSPTRLYIRFSIFLVDLVPDGGIESCLRLRPRKRESRGKWGRIMEHRFVDGEVHRASENSQEEKDKYSFRSKRLGGGRDLREQVVEVRRINDRLMMVKLVIGGCTLSVISAYAPQVGLDEETKKLFYEDLNEVVRGIPNTEKIVFGGDFNGHIGATSNGFDDVHGGFGFGERNGGGTSLLDFAKAFELVIANSYFPKKENHLVTFRSSVAKTQIDYFLLRKGDRGLFKDCKVIPSENLTTQHKLWIKWGGLTPASREMGEKLIGMGAWSDSGDADAMWNKAASCIREVASKVLAVSRGNFGGHKGDWWWNGKSKANEEVKRLRKVYKATKIEAKLAATASRRQLSTPDNEMGTKEGKVLVDEISIARCFRIEEVIRAISRMSGEEAARTDEIPQRCDEWRWSTMVPLYKTRRYLEAVTTTGYQIAKPYYEDPGESGGDEGEKRGVHLENRFGFMRDDRLPKPFILSLRPAYDKVPANVLGGAWRLEAIKDIYGGAKTRVRNGRRRLRNISQLRWPFLFALVMDELTRSDSGGGPMVIQGSGDIDDDVTHRMGGVGDQERTCPKNACHGDEDVEMDERGYPEKVGVASVVDKSRKARWFGHVKRQTPEMQRGRGRPKKYWGEVIRQDLAQLHLTEDMTLDRKEWRARIKVVVLVCDTYSLTLFIEPHFTQYFTVAIISLVDYSLSFLLDVMCYTLSPSPFTWM
ncbi:hypothetical protein H5410_044532 [Solanum commersonii]|uniref:Craniofacial development protein 2-like n=1 Tax=Solanum commersonii TaxID=4109 RepID=A0A9J5X8C8_SOLCO|nr:hypothetical protein H5410_044532 [Solanum commersonii]